MADSDRVRLSANQVEAIARRILSNLGFNEDSFVRCAEQVNLFDDRCQRWFTEFEVRGSNWQIEFSLGTLSVHSTINAINETEEILTNELSNLRSYILGDPASIRTDDPISSKLFHYAHLAKQGPTKYLRECLLDTVFELDNILLEKGLIKKEELSYGEKVASQARSELDRYVLETSILTMRGWS